MQGCQVGGSCKKGWLHKVEEYEEIPAGSSGRRPIRPSTIMRETGSLTQGPEEVRA